METKKVKVMEKCQASQNVGIAVTAGAVVEKLVVVEAEVVTAGVVMVVKNVLRVTAILVNGLIVRIMSHSNNAVTIMGIMVRYLFFTF